MRLPQEVARGLTADAAVRVPVALRPRRFSIEAHLILLLLHAPRYISMIVLAPSAAHLLLILVSYATHLPLIWTHLDSSGLIWPNLNFVLTGSWILC